MPSGILPDEGIAEQLSYILSTSIIGVLPWELMLFVNDVDVDYATVLGDLVEATWEGYSRLTLSRYNWTVPVVQFGCASSTWGAAPLVYDVGTVSPGTINYGAAYLDQSSGVLRWVQRFDDADLNPLVSGGQFSLLPQYTLTSAACGNLMTMVRREARLAKQRSDNGGH